MKRRSACCIDEIRGDAERPGRSPSPRRASHVALFETRYCSGWDAVDTATDPRRATTIAACSYVSTVLKASRHATREHDATASDPLEDRPLCRTRHQTCRLHRVKPRPYEALLLPANGDSGARRVAMETPMGTLAFERRKFPLSSNASSFTVTDTAMASLRAGR